MKEPLEFTIATRDFDRNLLPPDAGEISTDAFREAVVAHFAGQFAPLGGSAIVRVDDEQIGVVWVPDEVSEEPGEYTLSLLRAGRLAEAVPLLRTLLAASPDDDGLLYNLGMAESDLGELPEARRHLARAVELTPGHVDGLVALAVAQQRSGEADAALRNLERAVARQPKNGYAHRNLGAVLGNAGRHEEAETHFREAARLLPEDPAAAYGLAQALERKGGDDDLAEADGLYQRVIGMDGEGNVGETARQARSRLAQHGFRGEAGAPPRMDAVMYCASALQKFAGLPTSEVQTIAFEIAMLGRSGLDVNSPAQKYRLRSLPGSFSGLQLMCYMYVGFKQLTPETDIGFDLSEEYRTALGLHGQ